MMTIKDSIMKMKQLRGLQVCVPDAAEQPANGPADGPADGTADRTADGTADGPANGLADGTANGPADGPADGVKPSDAAEQPADGPANGLANGPAAGVKPFKAADVKPAGEPWCYVFTHNKVVAPLAERLEQKGLRCFIHRTTEYEKDERDEKQKVREVERNTISGLLFIQGEPDVVQQVLNKVRPGCHLAHDSATDRPAVIRDSQMVPFMRVMETDPNRIRILMKQYEHYAQDNIRLRIRGGILEGLEGYIIRINRDRYLVMKLGDYTVAIGDIHREFFEVAE